MNEVFVSPPFEPGKGLSPSFPAGIREYQPRQYIAVMTVS